MKKISVLILALLSIGCCLLFPGTQAEEEEAKKDILTISSLKGTPDVTAGGVSGMHIDVEANLSTRQEGGFPTLYALVYDTSKQPIKAAVTLSRYNIAGKAGCSRSILVQKFPVKLFIPYYILDLREGRHEIIIQISAAVKYGTAAEEKVLIRGKKTFSLTINKPVVRKFRVMVRELRVAEKNLRDNNWDNGSGRSRLPDLRCKVELGAKAAKDVVYASSVVKNSLSAAWIDYSGILAISEGDTINIVVYDKDTMFDDPIGRVKFKLEELKAVADKGEKIRFGLVNSCLIAVKIDT